MNDPALELIVKQLTTKLLNPKKDADVQRETAAIGIKAVVQEVSSTGQAAVLVQHATGQLLSGVQREVVLASQACCFFHAVWWNWVGRQAEALCSKPQGPFSLVKEGDCWGGQHTSLSIAMVLGYTGFCQSAL